MKPRKKLGEFTTDECPCCEGTGLTLDHEAAGQYVRQHREIRRISLRSAAREMTISPAYLSDLERGRRNWSQELWDDFMEVLGR